MSTLRDLTKKQVRAVVEYVDGDGHTIFDRKVLLDDCGWPAEIADTVCEKLESDMGSPKGMIFGKNYEVIEELYGWYGLSVLSQLAAVLEVDYEDKMGRGFRARSITKALLEHLDNPTVAAGEQNDV